MAQCGVVAEGAGLRWVLQEMSLRYRSRPVELLLISDCLESRALAAGGGLDGWCPPPGPGKAWGEHGAGSGLGTAPCRAVPLGMGQGGGAGHPDRAGAGCGGMDLAPGIPAPLHAPASGKVLFDATAPAGTALSATITSGGGKHHVKPRVAKAAEKCCWRTGELLELLWQLVLGTGHLEEESWCGGAAVRLPILLGGEEALGRHSSPSPGSHQRCRSCTGAEGTWGLCGTCCPAPLGPTLQVAWYSVGYIQWKG